MPSLRKSSRKSQSSTPYATPLDANSPTSATKKEKTQSFLDGWIEPPPKNPAPSFEEHGFARHGVLETMAPLGVPPTAKMKQRARGLPDAAGRRSLLGKNGNVLAGDDGVSTPEMTPARELEREDSERREDDDELPTPFEPLDEDDDDDYVPAKSKGKPNAAKTPVRGKTPVQNKTPVHSKTPTRNGSVRAAALTDSPARVAAPPLPEDVVNGTARQRLTIAVNDAVARAQSDRRPHLGTALQQLLDDSKTYDSVHEVLQAIINQNNTPQQLAVFKVFIKDRKRRAKREARQAKLSQSHNRRSGAGSYISTAAKNGANAPSPTHVGGLAGITDHHTSPIVPSDSIDTAMAEASQESGTALPSPAIPNPFSTAPALTANRSPSPTPTRMPSKSPRKPAKATRAASDRQNGAAVPKAAVNSPDSVIGEATESDLSDVDESIVQNGRPQSPTVNGTGSITAKDANARKPKAALLRNGKKSRANSVKPPGKNEKKPPPTAESLAEEAELRRKRQELADNQLSRQGPSFPISDTRFDDETLDTESLTDSQYAVGPPIDATTSRRAPRPSRINNLSLTNGKRNRDDMSSPLLESAASTRPSTPAVAQNSVKRLKLNNGQAARTKRSPVKNRDGPIAGIAHTGGGVSRQSGPDDNDPGSPPSESDDFCSACKGAGEFVCCDNCTRVYHFLCCDPPLYEPPQGSFLCHECDVKVRPGFDASASSSFNAFGPLFKQLESTNTRSFGLPSEIQDYFEGVTSKDDGSYSEDVKKFALSKSSGYGYQRPDYLKTHDPEHNPILCVQCGRSSAGKRQMLKCDFCPSYWHLDCCDPPLANPPHISLEAAQRDAWKCPRHVDHDLRSGQLFQNDLNDVASDDVEMIDATVARVSRKIRKPKKPIIIEPTFSRGQANNGLIEIMNDPDDDTDGEGNYLFSPDEPKDINSKVFRVPEKGIIADFITKVKQSHIEEREAKRQAKARRKESYQHLSARPIEQQQAALHLAQLANKEKDIGLDERSVHALVLGLKAEAPAEVISALSNIEPGPLSDPERALLQKLRELIDRRLAT